MWLKVIQVLATLVVGSPGKAQTMAQGAAVQAREARKTHLQNHRIVLRRRISQQRRCMAPAMIMLKLAKTLKLLDRSCIWLLLRARGVMIEHEVSGTGIKGNGGDMQGKNVTAKSPKTNHKHGNSSTNLNRSTNKPNDATYKPDIIACDLSPHAALGSQLSVSLESPHLSDCGSNKYYRGDLGALATPVGSVLKGSKRWEGSSDEDSSARAEHLKAKRNLDGSVTLHSNSFLAFSDCKVEKNIATLVVSLGNNVASTIACLKESELNRLVQASSTEPRQLE
jgi:hypothetical protein